MLSSTAEAAPCSLLQLIKDSAFLDLTSPMTAYEWFKAVFLFPWAFFKLIVVLLGLVIVWGWVRVRSRFTLTLYTNNTLCKQGDIWCQGHEA